MSRRFRTRPSRRESWVRASAVKITSADGSVRYESPRPPWHPTAGTGAKPGITEKAVEKAVKQSRSRAGGQ